MACGRCLKACSRGARRVVDGLPRVRAILDAGDSVAMLAPSFPAGYPQWKPGQVIAALRRAGFSAVTEVAFGADLVTREYARGFAADPDRLVITSACPASVAYIRKYAVNVVPYVAKILSPMAAMGKALKLRLRPGCRPVFIGPCTAKLEEILDPEVAPWVDGAITFQDMNALFSSCHIDPGTLPEEGFDGPPSNSGGAYPIPLGLVHAAGIPSDPIEDRVHSILTVESYIDIVHDLDRRIVEGRMEQLGARFFDVLYCRGCIAGPLLDSTESFLRRKERITAFYRAHNTPENRARAEVALNELSDLDVSRSFTADPQVTPMPTEEEIRQILARTGKLRPEDELNCRTCGYRSCRDKATAVFQGLAEEDMCLPYLIERLEGMVLKVNQSSQQLTQAHDQLLRAERLASMGQLAAGVAHEVNNPLGVILLYANIICEQVSASETLHEDARMILSEARRCKNIVSGLLDFARQNRVNRTRFEVPAFLDESIRIVRAQLDAREVSGIDYVTRFAPDLPLAHLDRDQMLQVLTNLIRNAAEIMCDHGTITVSADLDVATDELCIRVSDTGPGIPPEHMNLLFSPFFSTRPGGRGTGLGLPICYGITKLHRGTINASNNVPGPGATFEVRVPASPVDVEADAEVVS